MVRLSGLLRRGVLIRVHALGQVVNFQVSTRIPPERLPYALNAHLPADIVVTKAELVPPDFHARYSAQSKVYRYTIDCAPFPRVLTRYYAHHLRYPLDIHLMQEAAAALVGKHDFRSFMASGSAVKTTERHVLRLEITEQDQYVQITIEADGFYIIWCGLVGTLIDRSR